MTGAIAAAVIAAAAAAGTYYNGQQVAKKQDNNLAQQLRDQGLLQKKADAQTQDLINKTANSNDTSAKSSLLDQFMQQMNQNSGNTKAGLNQVGNVSSAYTKAANDAASGISTYGGNQAGLVSAIDAPGVQRQAESADQLRYGTGINQIKQQSSALDFLSNMKLRGIRPNPWIAAVSDAGSAYAGASSGGGGSASSGSSAPGWWDSSGSTGWGGV